MSNSNHCQNFATHFLCFSDKIVTFLHFHMFFYLVYIQKSLKYLKLAGIKIFPQIFQIDLAGNFRIIYKCLTWMLTTYISCSNSSFNDTEKRTNCFEIYYLSDFWCSLVISLLSVATINILNYQICQVCFFYHIFLSSFLLHPHKRNSIIHHFGWTQWSLKLLLLKAEQMYNFFLL